MKIWGPGTSSKNEKKKYSNPTGWGPGKVSLEGLAKKEADILLSAPKIVNGRLTVDNDALAQSKGFINAMDEADYKAKNPDLYEASGGVKVIKPGTNADMSGSPLKSVGTYDHNYATNLSNAAVNKAYENSNSDKVKEVENIVDTIKSGKWLDANTMKKYSETVSSYANSVIMLNELGLLNFNTEEDRKSTIDSLKTLKDDINKIKDYYADYKDEDAYNKALVDFEQKKSSFSSLENNKTEEQFVTITTKNKYWYVKTRNEAIDTLTKAGVTKELATRNILSEKEWRKKKSINPNSVTSQFHSYSDYLAYQVDYLVDSYAEKGLLSKPVLFNEWLTKKYGSPQKDKSDDSSKQNEDLNTVYEEAKKLENNVGLAREKMTFAIGDSYYKAKAKVEKEQAKLDAYLAESGFDRVDEIKGEIDKRTWFKESETWDGSFMGGVKTVLGTLTDLVQEAGEGAFEMPEKAIDSAAYLTGLFGGEEYQKKVSDFIASDLYNSEKLIKEQGAFVPFLLALMGTEADKASVAGEKLEGLAESAGQLGAQIMLKPVMPWYVTTGVTSFGSGVEEALNNGASYGEAGVKGGIDAAADILTEKLFGGSGLGEKGWINLDKLTKNITNKTIRNFAAYGIDLAANGEEEKLAAVMSRIGDMLTTERGASWEEILNNEEKLDDFLDRAVEYLVGEEAQEEYREARIGGMLLGGGVNSVQLGSSIKHGTDYRTGLTASEEAVFNNVYESKIADAEKDGKKLTKNEKAKLYDNVMRSLERGEIDTDTIEAVLGDSETVKELIEKDTKKLMGKNGKGRNSYLAESYVQQAKRRQPFKADLSQYEGKYQETIKKAVDSGILNDTRRTHEFIDMLAKTAAETGVNFKFTDNKELRNLGLTIENKSVDTNNSNDVLQSNADSVVDNVADNTVAQQGGQVDAAEGVGAVQSDSNGVAAPGVVEGADGKQYFDDGSGDEYFGDTSGDDVAHGGDTSVVSEAIDGENSNDLQLSEPALKDIARAPTAEESIAAAISNEQLDTKQRRILDFVEQHFPEITLKFSSNMTKNGLWDPESKTLLLNTNQKVAGMYIEVLKHEFMHRLESKRLYQEFKQFLFNKDVTFGVWAKVQCKVHGIELTQNATASEAISKLTEYYHDSVKNDMAIAKKYREAFTMSGAQREMVADFFGEVMFNGKKYRTQTAQALADETFITIFDESERAEFQASSMAALAEIAEYKPNIFRQIVDWVKRIILKLRGTRIKADAILADELERNIKMLEDYVKQVYNSRDTKKAAENGGGVEFAFGSNIMLNDADEEAYMSTGQSLHTRNKKTRMLEKGKNPVLKTSEEAKTFISQVIKGQAGGEVRTFGRVGQRLANAIKQKRSSLDLYGKYLEINADDLRESYKRHKNPKEKGDISLSDDDFCKIPEYLNSFDDVLSVNTYNGKIEIHISKETTDGYVKILTIVSKERESLQVTKIVGNSKSKFEKKYGTKKERDIGSPRGQTVKTEDSNPSTTARRTADALSNNSISNPDEIVNTEKNNDNNNDSSNSNQNPSFAVTSQMQQLRYNPEAYAKYVLRQFGAKNIDNERIAKKIKQIVAQDNKSAKAQEDTRQKVYDRKGNLVGELTLKERLINELAVEISESIEAPLMAEADEVLSGLKERPLRVNEKQEAEIRHQFGTLANFRKDTGIRLVSEKSEVAAGLTTLEDAWNGDWVTDYAGWFKGDVSDVNMPMRLAEIVEQLNSMTEELDTEAIAAEVADSLTKTLNETGPKAEKRRVNEAYRRGVADEHAKNKKQISELQKQNRNLKNRVKPKDVQNIRKEVERIYKKLAANSSTKHVHQGLKKAVSEFLELFNQSDEFTFKPADRDKVTRLWREYQKLAETDATSEAYGYDAQIAINIEMLEEILPGRSMWELHPDELAQVKEIIQNVSHCIEQTNNMIINGKAEEIATVANSVRVELGHKKGKIFDLGKLDLDMKNTTPIYFFERLGSKTLQKLFGGIKKGENVWAKNMLAARDKIAEIRKRYGYNKWKDVTLKFTTKLGDQIELDLEQAMLLYATVKRERANLDQEAEHTYIGGVVIPTKKVKSLMSDIRGFTKRDGESDANAKKRYEGLVESLRKQIDVAPHQIRVSDFAKVSDFLTEQQKAYVDEMVAYLSNDMAKLGNEVSMQLFGIEKFNEKYYIPYNSADNFIASMPGVEPTSSIKHRSFTKDLTHGANNPLMLTSFSEVCANHIEQMCMYNAMAIPVDNLTRVLNYTVPGTETSKATSIKDEIERVLGKSGLRYINNLIRDMSGSVRVSDLDSLVGRFTSRYKKAAVLASLSVVIQQPTSIVRAFKYIPAKYFLKTTFKVAERNYEQMKQYVGEAIIKEMGGFDTGVGATNSDYLLQPKRTVGQFIDDVAGWGANKADQITWGHIWAASKRMVAEQNPGLQVGSDAFFEKAAEICSETLSKTQVYDSVLVKSEAMRSKSELSKMMTAFMSEPTVTYNMMMGALRDVTAHKKGAVKALAGTSAVIIGQIVVNAAFKSLVYAMRDDDEDETYFEKWLASFVESSVSDLNYFNYLPYVKDIVSIMQGYSVERMDVAAIADIKQAIEKAFAEDVTDLERLKNLCTALSLLTGVPVKNIWRDAEGAYNTIHNAIKKDIVNTPEGSEKAAKVGFAEALDWLPGIEIDTDGSARLVSELEGNVTYDSFDDADKQAVEKGVSNYLKNSEKFEKGELRSKSKTFESLYETRRKYGSTSKKYRKERKKLIDSGIDEKDLELGLEIAKFKYLEQNGITVAEYYAAKTELNRKDGEDKVYDTDGSGGLNKKETKAAIKKMKGFDKDEKDILFDILKP